MGNNAPMIAGKSLATIEPRETFKSNQFKIDSFQLICRPVVDSVKSAAWSETCTPVQIVISLQVPCIHCFWSSSCGFPDVSHAGGYASYILQLQIKTAISSHRRLQLTVTYWIYSFSLVVKAKSGKIKTEAKICSFKTKTKQMLKMQSGFILYINYLYWKTKVDLQSCYEKD